MERSFDLVYDGATSIHEHRDALPRAFVVRALKVSSYKEGVFAELTSEGFDPGAYVALEEEPSNCSQLSV